MRQTLKALLFSACFACTNASAIVIDTLNTPVGFTISSDIGGGILLKASGTVSITSGFGSNSLQMHVTLSNSSTLNGVPYTPTDGVLLIGWGFGVDPNLSDVMFTNGAGGGMIDATQDDIPDLSGIEVCAWGGNGCSGNLPGGVMAGSSDSFDLILQGQWGQSVTFDPIGARFRTRAGDFSFDCTGSCADAASVPEPHTMVLFGVAFLALALARQRKAGRMPKSLRS